MGVCEHVPWGSREASRGACLTRLFVFFPKECSSAPGVCVPPPPPHTHTFSSFPFSLSGSLLKTSLFSLACSLGEKPMSSSRLLILARRLGASAQQQLGGGSSWLAGVGGGGAEAIANGVGGGLSLSIASPSLLPAAACSALGQVRW